MTRRPCDAQNRFFVFSFLSFFIFCLRRVTAIRHGQHTHTHTHTGKCANKSRVSKGRGNYRVRVGPNTTGGGHERASPEKIKCTAGLGASRPGVFKSKRLSPRNKINQKQRETGLCRTLVRHGLFDENPSGGGCSRVKCRKNHGHLHKHGHRIALRVIASP